MSYIYNMKAINDIPNDAPIQIDKTEMMITEEKWYGNTLGECVGKILNTGERESYFKKDIENGNTNLFDYFVENQLCKTVREKVYSVKTAGYYATFYYLMYKVQDHSSDKPTITKKALDAVMNVKYDYVYEILIVVDKKYRRYITVSIQTSGTGICSLVDEINSFEQVFEKWAENKEEGFRYLDGTIEVKCYNDIGEEQYIGFDNTNHLLMSINSIRIVDLKSKIIEIHP